MLWGGTQQGTSENKTQSWVTSWISPVTGPALLYARMLPPHGGPSGGLPWWVGAGSREPLGSRRRDLLTCASFANLSTQQGVAPQEAQRVAKALPWPRSSQIGPEVQSSLEWSEVCVCMRVCMCARVCAPEQGGGAVSQPCQAYPRGGSLRLFPPNPHAPQFCYIILPDPCPRPRREVEYHLYFYKGETEAPMGSEPGW